ncbi:MAG: sulfotransferase family protein [Planctomycetota bacterium]|nr:sulfotransferase family protein [Planctomycetota bacterium]
MTLTQRISLWSCPRTVSTALMRSFAQREDTFCVDEPFYAHYLARTGKAHPMREAVLAAQSSDWRSLLLGPCAKPVQFVKHMAHHLVGEMDLSFAASTRNVFLLRPPRETLPSMLRDLGEVRLGDVGYERQRELYHALRRAGEDPIVIESTDLLNDPEGSLRRLCARLGLAFDRAMLSWPPGRHPSYGVWAPYWYGNVEKSAGFQAITPKSEPFPEELEPLLAVAENCWLDLHARRLRA